LFRFPPAIPHDRRKLSNDVHFIFLTNTRRFIRNFLCEHQAYYFLRILFLFLYYYIHVFFLRKRCNPKNTVQSLKKTLYPILNCKKLYQYFFFILVCTTKPFNYSKRYSMDSSSYFFYNFKWLHNFHIWSKNHFKTTKFQKMTDFANLSTFCRYWYILYIKLCLNNDIVCIHYFKY
jgi:hypothetical protein